MLKHLRLKGAEASPHPPGAEARVYFSRIYFSCIYFSNDAEASPSRKVLKHPRLKERIYFSNDAEASQLEGAEASPLPLPGAEARVYFSRIYFSCIYFSHIYMYTYECFRATPPTP